MPLIALKFKLTLDYIYKLKIERNEETATVSKKY